MATKPDTPPPANAQPPTGAPPPANAQPPTDAPPPTDASAPTDARPPTDAPPPADTPPADASSAGNPASPATPAGRKRAGGWAIRVLVGCVIVAVCAASALGYGLTRPTIYGAQVELLLTPRPELSDTAAERAMLTQVALATSPAVLQPVATLADIPLAQLAGDVTAGMAERTNILQITVGDRDRNRALTLANFISVEYRRTAPTAGYDGVPAVESTVLTAPRILDEPLQPRPLRSAAGGLLVGLLLATALLLLWRPRSADRTPRFWT